MPEAKAPEQVYESLQSYVHSRSQLSKLEDQARELRKHVNELQDQVLTALSRSLNRQDASYSIQVDGITVIVHTFPDRRPTIQIFDKPLPIIVPMSEQSACTSE